jgi:tetratricopeptide (TPR) repeat protein
MSRLLRKGAIIGKVALATIVAGLLLYGAATLLKAELGDRSVTPSRTADDYLAAASAGLSSGRPLAAYDAATKMIAELPPSPQTGEAAERIASGIAVTTEWRKANELYAYAAQWATGTPLKRSLCGLAKTEARTGDATQCMTAVNRLSAEYAGDASVARAINDVAYTLGRSELKAQACQAYALVADKWTGSQEVAKAIKEQGMLRIAMDDGPAAAKCALRLLSQSVDDQKTRGYACLIADEMCKEWMWDDAKVVYEQMLAGKASNSEEVRATRGLAVVAIGQKKWDEATRQIDSIKRDDGTLPVDNVCGEIARAYKDMGRYAEAMPYYQAMVDKAGISEVGFLMRGKMVKCILLQGKTDEATAKLNVILAEFPANMAIGKRIVIEAVDDCFHAGRIAEAGVFAKTCQGKGRDATDEMWIRAATLKCRIAAGESLDGPAVTEAMLLDFQKAGPELADALVEVAWAFNTMGVEKQAANDASASAQAYAAAIIVSERIMQAFPQTSAAMDAAFIAAQSAEDTRDYGKALEFYTKAASAWPPHPENRYIQMHTIDCWQALADKSTVTRAEAKEGIRKACLSLKSGYAYDGNVTRCIDSMAQTWGIALEEGGKL